MRKTTAWFLVVTLFICAGCVAAEDDGSAGSYRDQSDGGIYSSSGTGGASSSESSGEESRNGSSRVIEGPGGTTYVFHESNGDTDIVPPNGDVTTVTTVGPRGVHIDTDGGHRGRHRHED